MPTWLKWTLLVGGLALGALGGILAVKVNALLFWVGWALGLSCIGVFIWKADNADEIEQENPVADNYYNPPQPDQAEEPAGLQEATEQ